MSLVPTVLLITLTSSGRTNIPGDDDGSSLKDLHNSTYVLKLQKVANRRWQAGDQSRVVGDEENNNNIREFVVCLIVCLIVCLNNSRDNGNVLFLGRLWLPPL